MIKVVVFFLVQNEGNICVTDETFFLPNYKINYDEIKSTLFFLALKTDTYGNEQRS